MSSENKELPTISCVSTPKRNLCPECGGLMKTIWKEKEEEVVCKSCGLSIPADELSQVRQDMKMKPTRPPNRKEEYLNWWNSSRKDKGIL